MFNLSDQAIQSFKKIYKEKFGIELDDIQANKLGVELLEFFKLIYRPIPKNQDNQTTKSDLDFK